MGLYDKYQLANSTQIPQYVGSALPEFARSVELAQERYDAASQGAIGIGETVTNAPFLAADAPTWGKIKQNADKDLEDWSSRGDYENLLPDVQRKARVVASRLKPIVESVQKRTEYAKSLDSKDLGLTELDKKTLLEMSDRAYKGVQFDETGRGFGQYTGRPADKNVDVNETIRKALSIMHPNSIVEGSGGENGMWRWKTKDGWVGIKKEDIRRALDFAYANDLEWKAHTDQQTSLETFRRTKNLDDNTALKFIDGLPESPTKQLATQALQKGISPRDIAERLVAQQVKEEQRSAVYGYGEAKAYNEYDRSTDQEYSSIYKMDYQHNLNKDMESLKRQWEKMDNVNPYIIAGPNVKLTDDEKNPDKVLQNNSKLGEQKSTIESEIKLYENQLGSGSLSPEKRVQIQSNLDNAKSRLTGVNGALNRNEQLLNYSRNRTAQEMGYAGGYEQLLNAEANKLLPEVQKMYPDGLKTKSGKTISPQEISKLIVERKVTPNAISTIQNIPGGGIARDKLTGVTLDTKDGKVFVTLNSGAEKLKSLYEQSSISNQNRLNEFNKKFRDNYTSNVKDFSLRSETIGISEKESADLTRTFKGSLGGLEFYEPGQAQPISESNRPENFKIVGMGSQGVGDMVTVRAEGLDEKGNPTGKTYDIRTNDVNVQKSLAYRWENSGAPEATLAARTIRPGSGARIINSMAVGDKKVIGSAQLADGTVSDLTVQPIRNPDNSVSYKLYDNKGNILQSTNSSSEAGLWIDKFTGMDNLPPYLNPKKRLKSTTTKSSKTVSTTISDVNY